MQNHEQWQHEVEQFGPKDIATLISHDLRSPLQVAHARIELARGTGDMEHLEAAETAIMRVEQLLEDLTTFAQEDELLEDVRSIELETVARLSWETVATKSATLTVESSQPIRADVNRFQRLLENLLRNCVMHGGEAVNVRVGMLPDADGFYVADDGCGIDSSKEEHIFEPKYSTEPEGTGYGLAIVQRIAEAHDWSIAVTSSRDGGARFEISGVDVAEQ